MATFMKCLPFLRPFSLEVRTVRCYKHRKKIPKWADPNDLSWAKPLLERQERLKNAKPAEPSMLHLVMRIKSLKDRPYWEKETMEQLGLRKPIGYPRIHKNTPDINAMLKSVNHLIKVVPITFPNGLPKTEEDFENSLLKDNGEFIIRKTLQPVEVVDTKIADRSVWTMGVSTFVKENKKKLENYSLNQEYFQPKYEYRYNQDKKEWRYFGNKNVGGDRDWN